MGDCALFLSRWGSVDWNHCCTQHDFDYGHQVGKAIADQHLAQCVNAIVPHLGDVMWLGVTLFGTLWYMRAGIVNWIERKR